MGDKSFRFNSNTNPDINSNTNTNINSNTNGSGQECPLHTQGVRRRSQQPRRPQWLTLLRLARCGLSR